MYKATFEKLTSVKTSFGKVISDDVRKTKFWSTVNIMTQMRCYGSRVFSDCIIYAVIDRVINIKTINELTSIVRACCIVNTKDNSEKEDKNQHF